MNKALIVLLSLLMSACATPYQSQGFTGGFSETQLDENVFQVTFRGNGYTSRERTADFTLLRSAELALERGFAYFVVVDSQQYSRVGTYTTPSHTQASVSMYGNTAYGSATTYGGHTYVTVKPRSSNTIVCFREKPEGFAYNAKFLIKSLKEKYGLVEEPQEASMPPNEAANSQGVE